MAEGDGIRPRIRSVHPEGGRVMTKQADALASDVNAIMAKWIAHGVVPLTRGTPRYGNFADAPSYHEALSRIKEAERDFMELPSSVRKECENDVGVFVEMVSSPEGLEVLKQAGLREERVPDTAEIRTARAAQANQAAPEESAPPGEEPA